MQARDRQGELAGPAAEGAERACGGQAAARSRRAGAADPDWEPQSEASLHIYSHNSLRLCAPDGFSMTQVQIKCSVVSSRIYHHKRHATEA